MFHPLKNIKDVKVPEKIQFPYFYFPHEIAVIAANDLKDSIPTIFPNNTFGINDGSSVGKMFGVLVVQNEKGEIGYLRAFSGRLNETTNIDGFVTPICDMLDKGSYYREREDVITKINSEVEELLSSKRLAELRSLKIDKQIKGKEEIAQLMADNKRAKAQRKTRREEANNLMENERDILLEEMNKESMARSFLLQNLRNAFKLDVEKVQQKISSIEEEIEQLKTKRAQLSKKLQNWIFEQYRILNYNGESKDLLEIFKDTAVGYPISGSGDCAAPRLFQYAFLNRMKPIALAEFWYGVSPDGVIRKHGKYYTACRGKCEPILSFMLKGLDIEENPLLEMSATDFKLEVLYEDEGLVAVNKPSGVLSVPGRTVNNSVYTKLAEQYENIYTIHRLDMATSGILLFAKTEKMHKVIQKLFSDREMSKTYQAILDASPINKKGTISLPLSPSFVNRPMQGHDINGKEAITEYEVIGENEKGVFIQFKPLTGRTHQLRLHAAHHKGLNAPIKGDILYATPSNRLYLHAAHLEFVHPLTKELISISCPSQFFKENNF